ncbi:hypothetical protein PIB30_051380 [Stylosanthes scabra]|uniref:Replication factor A C-terminal domain-containing protein n=1 Tax=Stylosanthes scabra TaxID=79078 RepID=A0ABU6SIP6_9FABA|nr:hypothetical protein [Stylosanthes scabra]
MKIEDVIKCTEECKPWIAASIVALNNGMHDCYYTACADCGKNVECAPNGIYVCIAEKCGHTSNKPRSKFKVEVIVYDGTACLNLLMWDTQVIQLCGKRADQVAKEDMEELGYPPTLDNLIESSALFKTNVKLNNIEKDDRVYTVSNICEDDDLVRQHLPADFTSQANETVTELGGSNSVEDSEAVANLQNGIRDDSVSTRTPGKRPVADQTGGSSGVDEAELEGQLSTNKLSRRGVKKRML